MNVGSSHGSSAAAPPGRRCRKRPGPRPNERRRKSTAQQRSVDAQAKSERASGIGETEQDQQASERDADGRRLWEETGKKKTSREAEAAKPRQAKDPTGVSGNSLI